MMGLEICAQGCSSSTAAGEQPAILLLDPQPTPHVEIMPGLGRLYEQSVNLLNGHNSKLPSLFLSSTHRLVHVLLFNREAPFVINSNQYRQPQQVKRQEKSDCRVLNYK